MGDDIAHEHSWECLIVCAYCTGSGIVEDYEGDRDCCACHGHGVWCELDTGNSEQHMTDPTNSIEREAHRSNQQEGASMTEQQQFQPGDRVKVTAELTVVDEGEDPFAYFNDGTAYPSTVERWANELDHVDVELIERPEPPREPGWYLCNVADSVRPLKWDGAMWCWPETGKCLPFQNNVVVVGTITLNEGVEL